MSHCDTPSPGWPNPYSVGDAARLAASGQQVTVESVEDVHVTAIWFASSSEKTPLKMTFQRRRLHLSEIDRLT